MKTSILYIINFYGSPPLNYFEKFLKQYDDIELYILKLPAVRPIKGKLVIDAFIKDASETKYPYHITIPFFLPYSMMFFIQYILNIVIFLKLLNKVKRNKFDIVVGETNFGSTLSYFTRKFGKADYSVYFNGDILLKPSVSNKNFFLPNTEKNNRFIKALDSLLVYLQLVLRKIGYKNDLIWYANDSIKKSDTEWRLHAIDEILYDPILIDFEEYKQWHTDNKNMNSLCYIGRIDDYVGLDIIIPSLSKILKNIPDITLHIIGGNDSSAKKYQFLAKKCRVENRIIFHGFIPNMEDAYKIISHCALGMALYKPSTDNVSMYAQPAKPKEYLKVGVPVLVTRNGPLIGSEIVRAGAGVMADFSVESVTSVIIKTLSDKAAYEKLEKGVKEYAQKNHYERVFSSVWKEILMRYNKSHKKL